MGPLALLLPLVVQTPDVAIVNARIEIGDGRAIESGTIVLRAGKIVALGDAVAAPAGARIVDGKGLVAMPGFIDAYGTAGLKLPDPLPNVGPAPDTLNTAPATMWAGNRKTLRADVRAATALDPKANFEAQARAGIVAVLRSGGTGSLAGTAALVSTGTSPRVLAPEVAHEMVLRAPGGGFGGEDAQGAPPQTPPGRPAQTPAAGAYPYPQTLYGVIALVRQTLYDARTYAGTKPDKPDPTYEGLRPLVTGRIPALATIANAREIARVARLSDEFGFRFIVNGGSDAYRLTDLLKRRNVPVIVSLDLPEEPRRTPGTTPDAAPARVLEDRYALYRERLANARVLNDSGILIAFRSGETFGGADFLTRVRALATASGLSRDATMRVLALNPARMFGVERTHGTLEVGKSASLVLLSGDFLDPKTTVRATYVEGAEVLPAPTTPAK